MKKIVALLAGMLLLMNLSSGALAGITGEEQAYYKEQMEIMVEEIGNRNMADIGQEEALSYLTDEFQTLGCSFADGTLQLCHVDDGVNITQDFASDDVIGIRKAQSDTPNIIVLCAHYDSNGPGARDNASGVAGVLTLLRRFAQTEPYANAELRFIAFTAEESGHQGSAAYVESLSQDEKDRILAVFNMDIIVLDPVDVDFCLSLDTLGKRTADGYADGQETAPADNRAVRAFMQALWELRSQDPAEYRETYAVLRHRGDSDHDSFHNAGIDSVNISFRGNPDTNGNWTDLMHTMYDLMDEFDWPRTWQTLDILYTAVDGLARDASYGD